MSLPLSAFREHSDCGVLVICRGCRQWRSFDLEAVISRLTARGLAGETVPILAVADHVRPPCPRCGGRTFESRPAWDHGKVSEPPRPPYGGF